MLNRYKTIFFPPTTANETIARTTRRSKLREPIVGRKNGEKLDIGVDGARIEQVVAEGGSAVLRFEDTALLASDDPARVVQRTAEAVFRLPVSVHAYISGVGDTALHPHTDPYDTVVLQLAGGKEWTTCIPKVKVLGNAESGHESDLTPSSATNSSMMLVSSADQAQLHEIEINHIQGCTAFNFSALDGMQCTTFALDAGDVLYLPKGVVHYARNVNSTADKENEKVSAHLTLGLDRTGATWQAAWEAATATAINALPAEGRRSTAEQAFVEQLQTADTAAFETPRGVRWLAALPLWRISSASERASAGSGNASDGTAAHFGDANSTTAAAAAAAECQPYLDCEPAHHLTAGHLSRLAKSAEAFKEWQSLALHLDHHLNITTAAAQSNAIGSRTPFYPRLRISELQAALMTQVRSRAGFEAALRVAQRTQQRQQQQQQQQAGQFYTRDSRSKRGETTVKPRPSQCSAQQSCASILNNFCGGVVSTVEKDCQAECDGKTKDCECDESDTCDEFGAKLDGHTDCDDGCKNTASCECDTPETSCECDQGASCDSDNMGYPRCSCSCDQTLLGFYKSSCSCDDKCPDCWSTPSLIGTDSCACDTDSESCECDNANRCHTSCDKDESCEADESCECDEIWPLRTNGGEECDADCAGCGGLELCTCCAGLSRRSQTLCCPPLPEHAKWTTLIDLVDDGGDCGWECEEAYVARDLSTTAAIPEWLQAFEDDGALLGWSKGKQCCYPKPENSEYQSETIGCAWECSIANGYTRGAETNVYRPDQGDWGCKRCKVCPDGTYHTADCTATAQTTCTACDACPEGFVDGGGCTGGKQNRVCLGKISHARYPNPIYTNDDPAAVVFTVSGIHGAGASVTIVPVVTPAGALLFEPSVLTMTASSTATTTTGVSGTFSLTSPANFSAGAYKVSYKLGGDTACPCRPSSDEDLPCKGGCNDGSGVMPMPDELVIVRNSDHITVFERLGIAVGALPVTPVYAIPAFACDEALDGFEFVSTHPWQKSELTISRAEVNALKCSQWVTEETTETELAWTREVEAAHPCPCKESDINTGVFSSESDHLRQLSTFFQLSRYHPGAEQCYRSKATSSGYGQQCCYAEQKLITSGPGAGSMDKVAPSSRDSVAGHVDADVNPFAWCGEAKGWKTYGKARPASNVLKCAGFEPEINFDLSSSQEISHKLPDVMFTCGVVKLSIRDKLKIPFSIAGGAVDAANGGHFKSFGPLYNADKATCGDVPFVSDDILDFVSSGAIGRGIMKHLSLPKWFRLHDAGLPAANFNFDSLSPQVVLGKDAVKKYPACEGLPVNADTEYTIFRYNRPITVGIGGAPVMFDASSFGSICLLLDICTSGGCSGTGGVSFMVGVAGDLLGTITESVPALQQLAESGLSMKSGRVAVGGLLEAFKDSDSPWWLETAEMVVDIVFADRAKDRYAFWNGDELFEHGERTEYNFYIGGTIEYKMPQFSLEVDGNAFFSLPGLCGDWRDIFGDDGWSAAITGSVTLQVSIFGFPAAFVLADTRMLVSLGGADRSDSLCTKWTDYTPGKHAAASPPGIFFVANVETPTPFDRTPISKLFPKVEVGIKGFLSINQNVQLIPKAIGKHFVSTVKAVANGLARLAKTMLSAIKTGASKTWSAVTSPIVEGVEYMIKLASCTFTSGPCPVSTPSLSGVSAGLESIVDAVRAASGEIKPLRAKVLEIGKEFDSVIGTLKTGASNAANEFASEIRTTWARLQATKTKLLTFIETASAQVWETTLSPILSALTSLTSEETCEFASGACWATSPHFGNVKSQFDFIKSTITGSAGKIGTLRGSLNPIKDAFDAGISGFNAGAIASALQLGSDITTAGARILALKTKLLGAIKDTASEEWETATSTVADALGQLKELQLCSAKTSGCWIKTSFMSDASDALDAIQSAIADSGGFIAPLRSNLRQLQDNFGVAVAELKDGVKGTVAEFKADMKETWSELANLKGELVDSITTAASDTYSLTKSRIVFVRDKITALVAKRSGILSLASVADADAILKGIVATIKESGGQVEPLRTNLAEIQHEFGEAISVLVENNNAASEEVRSDIMATWFQLEAMEGAVLKTIQTTAADQWQQTASPIAAALVDLTSEQTCEFTSGICWGTSPLLSGAADALSSIKEIVSSSAGKVGPLRSKSEKLVAAFDTFVGAMESSGVAATIQLSADVFATRARLSSLKNTLLGAIQDSATKDWSEVLKAPVAEVLHLVTDELDCSVTDSACWIQSPILAGAVKSLTTIQAIIKDSKGMVSALREDLAEIEEEFEAAIASLKNNVKATAEQLKSDSISAFRRVTSIKDTMLSTIKTAASNVFPTVASPIGMVAKELKDILSCTFTSGPTGCWSASPEFYDAADKLRSILDILQGSDGKVQPLADVVDSIEKGFDSAVATLKTAVGSAAAKLTTSAIDLVEGVGVRVEAGLDLGVLLGDAYFAVRLELTYTHGAALKRCDKFKFVYDDIFDDVVSGLILTTAKINLLAASGQVSSAGAAFDGDETTAWQPDRDWWSDVLFPDAAVGLVFWTSGIETLQELHFYTPRGASSVAEVTLELLDSDNATTWDVIATATLAHGVGWQSVTFDSIAVENWAVWRVMITKQYTEVGGVDSSDAAAKVWAAGPVPTNDGRYPVLHELRMVGMGPRYVVAAEGRFLLKTAFSPTFPLSLIKIKATAYFEIVMGLNTAPSTLTVPSTDGNFLLRTGIESTLLGMVVEATAILTAQCTLKDGSITGVKGGTLTYAVAGRIWNLFDAQVAFTVSLRNPRLGLFLKGRFRQTFQDKVVTAVTSILDAAKNEANERFDAAQKEMKRWKAGVGTAIDKIDEAKDWLDEKKTAFLSCKSDLDSAKQTLENAKGPFKRAQQYLRDVQADVDSICTYRDCEWSKPWNCAFNAGCFIVRGAAYIGLELAKLALEAPMLALDVAKIGVDVAKVAVDIAAFGFDLASAQLSQLQFALRGVQLALDLAVAGVEVIQQTVAFGLEVANQLVKFTVGELFNVREVTFATEYSVANLYKFEIEMDLTIVGIRIENFRFEFDFGNAVSAFTSLVSSLVNQVKKALGFRRRRDLVDVLDRTILNDDAWEIVGASVRGAVDQDAFDRFILHRGSRQEDESIKEGEDDFGDIPAQSPPQIQTTCDCFDKIQAFYKRAGTSLAIVVAHEKDLAATKQRTLSMNTTFQKELSGFTLKSMQIDPATLAKFNIEPDILTATVSDDAIQQSVLVSTVRNQIAEYTTAMLHMVDSQPAWQDEWLVGLVNASLGCSSIKCQGFSDCSEAALSYLENELAVYRVAADLCNSTVSQEQPDYAGQTGCPRNSSADGELRAEKMAGVIQRLRAVSVQAVGYNEDETATNSRTSESMSGRLTTAVDHLVQLSVQESIFCGAPPKIHVHPRNRDEVPGSTVSLMCGVSGVPTPEISWTKNGETITNEHSSTLLLQTLKLDDATNYQCVASNMHGSTASTVAVIRVSSSSEFNLHVDVHFIELPGRANTADGNNNTQTAATDGLGLTDIASFLHVPSHRIIELVRHNDVVSFAIQSDIKVYADDDGSTADERERLEALEDVVNDEPTTEIYQRLLRLNCGLGSEDDKLSFIYVDDEITHQITEVSTKLVARVHVVEHAATPFNAFTLVVPGEDHIHGTITFSKRKEVVDGGDVEWTVHQSNGVVTIESDIDRETTQMDGLSILASARFIAFPGTHESISWHQCAKHDVGIRNAFKAAVASLQPLVEEEGTQSKQCQPSILINAGICVSSDSGMSCNPVQLESAQAAVETFLVDDSGDNDAGGARFTSATLCAVLEAYSTNAEQCRAVSRINVPLLQKVYKQCRVNGCNRCELCKNTDIDSVVQSQSNAIDQDTVDGCGKLVALVAEVDACVEANGVIVPADQIIFNPKTAGNQALRSLLQTHCTNIMNVVPAVTYDRVFAAATALAFADDSALQCETEVVPFLMGLAEWKEKGNESEAGQVEGEDEEAFSSLPYNVVQEVVSKCQRVCAPQGLVCGRKVEVDFKILLPVDDINDHPPLFEQDSYAFTVEEEAGFDVSGSGGEIGQVVALDADDVLVHYTIAKYRMQTCTSSTSSQTHAGKEEVQNDEKAEVLCSWKVVTNAKSFKVVIDTYTGVLAAAEPLDYEQDGAMIELTVQASDTDSYRMSKSNRWTLVPARSAQSIVTVTLIDRNDNWPVIITHLPLKNGTTAVSRREDEAPGDLASILRAEDLDQLDDGKLHFQITGGDAGGVFIINRTSGILMCTRYLDYEETSSYLLTIEVVDSAGHASAPFLVTITVEDVNEFGFFAPSDAETFYPLTVNQETDNPSQSLIYTVQIPEDIGNADDVLFKLSAGEDVGSSRFSSFTTFEIGGMDGSLVANLPFTVEPTGWVLLNGALDREATAIHRFEVVASTASNAQREAIATVEVVVVDANDNDPTFSSAILRATINQTSLVGVGDVIMNLADFSSDLDEGDNAKLQYSYSIATGEGEQPLQPFSGSASLDEWTGAISIIRANYSGCDELTARVVAHDGGDPQRSTTNATTVIISVVPCDAVSAEAGEPKSKATAAVVVVLLLLVAAVGGMLFYRQRRLEAAGKISKALAIVRNSKSSPVVMNSTYIGGNELGVQDASGATFTIPISPTSRTMFPSSLALLSGDGDGGGTGSGNTLSSSEANRVPEGAIYVGDSASDAVLDLQGSNGTIYSVPMSPTTQTSLSGYGSGGSRGGNTLSSSELDVQGSNGTTYSVPVSPTTQTSFLATLTSTDEMSGAQMPSTQRVVSPSVAGENKRKKSLRRPSPLILDGTNGTSYAVPMSPFMPLSPLSPISPALHTPFEVDLTIDAETVDVATPIGRRTMLFDQKGNMPSIDESQTNDADEAPQLSLKAWEAGGESSTDTEYLEVLGEAPQLPLKACEAGGESSTDTEYLEVSDIVADTNTTANASVDYNNSADTNTKSAAMYDQASSTAGPAAANIEQDGEVYSVATDGGEDNIYYSHAAGGGGDGGGEPGAAMYDQASPTAGPAAANIEQDGEVYSVATDGGEDNIYYSHAAGGGGEPGAAMYDQASPTAGPAAANIEQDGEIYSVATDGGEDNIYYSHAAGGGGEPGAAMYDQASSTAGPAAANANLAGTRSTVGTGVATGTGVYDNAADTASIASLYGLNTAPTQGNQGDGASGSNVVPSESAL